MEEVKTAAAPPFPPATKKRPLDSNAHSNYLKIRAVIRDLRPHFLEVIRTSDYKKCKASREIQQQLKIVSSLYESMKADAVSLAKSKNMQDGQSKAGQNMDPKTLLPSDIKPTPPVPGFHKQLVEDGLPGSYVVGGSAFGWNFITFAGKEPVYCGRSKEEFRSGKVSK